MTDRNTSLMALLKMKEKATMMDEKEIQTLLKSTCTEFASGVGVQH